MSNSIFASLRESFPSNNFTIAATSGGSTTAATNLYYWVNGYSRGGMNLLTSLGRIAVSVGQKLVFTVTTIAPGDDVFGFILSASETNDETTAKILAIADARDINQVTMFSAPIVTELTHDSHFGLGITGALPTTNRLNGMIRYADGEFRQWAAQSGEWQIVNGWNAYLETTLTPLSTGVYKNGCDIPILSNESVIDLPDYTGGTSTTFRLALLNGLTESSGSILTTGSKISLVPLIDNDYAIAADYLNGLIQITPIHVSRRSDGTVTALSTATLTWEWGKPFYTLTSDLQRGYAIAFDITVVNATLPQGSTLTFYLAEYGRISEKVQSNGSGSLVYAEGDKCRIYPWQSGILRGTGNGLIEVLGETYAYPINATIRESFSFGMLSNTADQVIAISGISNGEITWHPNINQVLATERIRAIASTASVTVTASDWVSVGSVTANQLINVTVDYPCDVDGIGTIRADYPDVIAGSAIGQFNVDKLRVFLRKDGTTITETSAIAVTPGTSQGFTITSIGTTAALPATTASDIGFWGYGSISTTKSGNSSDLTAGTYEICIAYQYEGNKVVSISHSTLDGCIPELPFDLATAIAKSEFFSKIYQSGTVKDQVEGLNFANNWFTVTRNGSSLDVELTGVSRLWPVATAPNSSFDYADGVRSGDSARLTASPYTIYDCLDATTGSAVWQERGSGSGGSGGYTTITEEFTIPAIAASDTVTVADASFLIDGLYIALPGGHYLLVDGDPVGTTVNLTNDGFAIAASVISNGSTLTVAGKPVKGDDGISAYDVAVVEGFVGDESAWLASLVGDEGAPGGIISTLSITTSFTIPAIASTQTQDFDDTSWVSVGATVFFSDGTNFACLEVTTKSGATLTLKNTWGHTNGTTIAIAGVLSPSGIPGIDGTNGANADMTRTSTSSVAIGTGSKSFTYSSSSNLGWGVGSRLRASYDASNYIEGVATAVSSTSTAIDVDNAVGSGTYTSWNIAIGGDKGVSSNTFLDNVFRIQDNVDATKQIAFEVSGITTGTTRTLTPPDASGNLLVAETLTDKGLYYYDATSKLMKPIGIGTVGQALLAQPLLDPPYQFGTVASSGREILTSNRTYYVRTDGSDSNTGLVDSSGGAFLTISKFFDTLVTLDKNGYNVTCQVANGTYSISQPIIVKDGIGSGKVFLTGNTTTPSSCLITSSANIRYITKDVAGTLEIKGFKFTNTGNNNDTTFILVTDGITAIGDLEFGETTTGSLSGQFHLNVSSKAVLYKIGDYTISGKAAYHEFITVNGVIRDYLVYNPTGSNITVTLTGTPSFFTFNYTRYGGLYDVYAPRQIFSGSATGLRYQCESLGGIFTLGGSNYFPGNNAGTTSTGGQYV